ncbi:MAG TPA: acetyl-CoA C-acyltransferase [Chitinophagales bacterium]|nr:acetyl-CoA C-acyltransferase [Chitinophagales bacterium]
MKNSRIVLIDGCRTPFLRSGTDYMDLMSYELAQFAIKGLLNKTGIHPKHIDAVVMGTVISNIRTSNVAREAALAAGIPYTAPCHTVTMACISANRAIADAVYALMAGHAQVVVAGGVDTASDTPIGYTKEMRKKLFKAQKLKGTMDMLKFAATLRPQDFMPDKPAIAEFSTNRTMGQDCEILASKYGVSRKEQDEFAVRSHQLAAQAAQNGNLAAEMTPVAVPPTFMPISADNGVRGDTTYEGVAKLNPAFDRQFGTITAANASFLTDGAAAVLLTTEAKAQELGLTPKAVITDFAFTGQDLEEELLLGPAFATYKLLAQTGLSLDDIDVFEFHEAFAGQILANLNCLASDEFAQNRLGLPQAAGVIPMEKFNLWGGSLSIGHPFGATGARLLTTAANRLHKENGKRALLAACAAGAHGHAMLIERW